MSRLLARLSAHARCRAARFAVELPQSVSPERASTVIKLVAAALALYVVLLERSLSNAIVAVACTLLIAAVLTAISRRPMFAVYATAGLVGIILAASLLKRHFLKMLLHAYDVVFYLGNFDTLRFLWSSMGAYVAVVGLTLSAFLASCWMAFRLDPLRTERRQAVLAAVGLAGIGAIFMTGHQGSSLIYKNEDFLSSFYRSWLEVGEAFSGVRAIEAAKAQTAPPFAKQERCEADHKLPHILLIHQESVVPPHYFTGLSYDRSLDSFFRSHDGTTRKLGVEVFGGGSWMTEFSVVSGVSSHAFGGLRQFVMTSMKGQLDDTLPQALAQCGYTNVFFNPMRDGFLGQGAFYRSVGMHETLDQKAQGAPTHQERDRFYYANMLARIEKQVATGRGPLFAYMLTMSGHMPYNFAFAPEERVPGGGPGTSLEMSEYLRRLALAKIDYEAFVRDLERRFPGESFLIVQYGDHQPVVADAYLGVRKSGDYSTEVVDPDSDAYSTYYSVNAINFPPPALPDTESLHVAYLGSVIMRAAGLPLSEAHEERMRLMRVCGGRYDRCQARQEILDFHARLIDSSLLKIR